MFWSSLFRRGTLVLGRWETPSFPALSRLYVLIKCVVEVPSFLRRLSRSQIALEWMYYYFKDNFLEPLLNKLSFSWKFLCCSRAAVFVEHPDSGLSCSTEQLSVRRACGSRAILLYEALKTAFLDLWQAHTHHHGSDKLCCKESPKKDYERLSSLGCPVYRWRLS